MNNSLGTGSLFDSRLAELGEGPVWDQQSGRVYWVDILGKRILWHEFESGNADEIALQEHVSAVLPTTGPNWIVCLPDGIHELDLETAQPAQLTPFSHRLGMDAGNPQMRANDAKVSPSGQIFAGTMPYEPDKHPGTAALYRFHDSLLETVSDDVTISNGIGWSPDGSLAYYVDTVTSRVDVWDVDLSGRWSNRRPFAEIPPDAGYPDGLSVDRDGYVWVALWSGYRVQRISPNGEMSGYIELPAKQVTSCAFAGNDLQTLIITTAQVDDEDNPWAGQTFQFPAPVPGLPTARATI